MKYLSWGPSERKRLLTLMPQERIDQEVRIFNNMNEAIQILCFTRIFKMLNLIFFCWSLTFLLAK